MAHRQTNFEEVRNWLLNVDPENRSVVDTMRVMARLVVSANDDPEVLKQAQQIIGGQ